MHTRREVEIMNKDAAPSDLFVVVQERAHERQNDSRYRYEIRKISISIKFHFFFILPALVVAAVAAPPVVVATTATWSQ